MGKIQRKSDKKVKMSGLSVTMSFYNLLVDLGGNMNGVQGGHDKCVTSDLIFFSRVGQTGPLK